MAIRLSTWLWRAVIALVFLMAAWAKWDRGIEYVRPVSVYDRIVAGSTVRHYAILSVEVLVGVWMLSGVKLRWAAIYTAVILTAFIILLGFEIRSANPEVCDCGLRELRPGGDPRVDLAIGIVRNAVLLLGCAWIWLLGEEPIKPLSAPPAPPAPPAPSA